MRIYPVGFRKSPGATPWTAPQVIDQETGLPIADVSCCYNRPCGRNVIAGILHTDALGYVKFLLNSGSYFCKIKNGYNLPNPTPITVT